MTGFWLHPDLDVEALRGAFAARGRVRIAPFLRDDCADRLAAHLLARDDWKQHINSGEKWFELDRETRAGFSAERRAALEAAVNAQAARGFQYRFEGLRVADDAAGRAADGSLLSRFGDFLNSGPVLVLLRAVTGVADVALLDAQATLYSAGDFLTVHDDDVAGKHRRAAYVLNLTRDWRADWGGLLLLHDAGRSEAWAPAWNSLSLFAVPHPHSVSQVSSFATGQRLSVTGWLRAAG
ncbi:2OG-Fe(II) oxygenase [Sandaracinobacteroides saxicola]|uniref:2OG-Fe(II) oxygenase n=1 Tax=Sandaracinobacteroides saxicola TaxID=2759707 RepID=A0A7G5IEI9_9SPHN|nr:2OG-Fe(II) oxygenase family protein [Sandaracinobacteroides saxicola]QMW21781.1 2OG-Fe(II) oxygenase [Sandaracinobacteroides saxicola]